MFKKFLVFVSVAIVLVSCGGRNEYAYNEKTANLFLMVMEHVDNTHKKLQDGGFEPGLESSQFSGPVTKPADQLIQFIEQSENELNALTPSEEAKEFDGEVKKYFNDVKTKYYTEIRNYLQEKDTAKQKEIYQNLEKIYHDLSLRPDQVLEVQKKYMKKTGLD